MRLRGRRTCMCPAYVWRMPWLLGRPMGIYCSCMRVSMHACMHACMDVHAPVYVCVVWKSYPHTLGMDQVPKSEALMGGPTTHASTCRSAPLPPHLPSKSSLHLPSMCSTRMPSFSSHQRSPQADTVLALPRLHASGAHTH